MNTPILPPVAETQPDRGPRLSSQFGAGAPRVGMSISLAREPLDHPEHMRRMALLAGSTYAVLSRVVRARGVDEDEGVS